MTAAEGYEKRDDLVSSCGGGGGGEVRTSLIRKTVVDDILEVGCGNWGTAGIVFYVFGWECWRRADVRWWEILLKMVMREFTWWGI
ncbi:hypothetical protein Tco_0826558 [Tanacetum coccineum]